MEINKNRIWEEQNGKILGTCTIEEIEEKNKKMGILKQFLDQKELKLI